MFLDMVEYLYTLIIEKSTCESIQFPVSKSKLHIPIAVLAPYPIAIDAIFIPLNDSNMDSCVFVNPFAE